MYRVSRIPQVRPMLAETREDAPKAQAGAAPLVKCSYCGASKIKATMLVDPICMECRIVLRRMRLKLRVGFYAQCLGQDTAKNRTREHR